VVKGDITMDFNEDDLILDPNSFQDEPNEQDELIQHSEMEGPLDEKDKSKDESVAIKMIGVDFIDVMLERANIENAYYNTLIVERLNQCKDEHQKLSLERERTIIQDAMDMLTDTLLAIRDFVVESDDQSIPADSLSILPSLINNIMAWKPIAALTGAEEEWKDMSNAPGYKDMIGKTWWITTQHIEGTGIPIQSVQYNIRARTILRFNNDNRLAHRTDAQRFVDSESMQEIPPHMIQASPVRFIKFPYVFTPTNTILINTKNGDVVGVTNPGNIGINSSAYPDFIMDAIQEDKKKHPEDYDDAPDNINEISQSLSDQVMAFLNEDNGEDDE